jgi:dihydrofolate reductase
MSERKGLKVSVFIATSVDGYIARPDGDVAWLHEIDPLEDGDDAGYGEIFNAVDALVMGRGSFEKVLEFDPWPYGEKPVIVLSKTLTELPPHLADVVRIDPASPRAFVKKILEWGYEHIYLDGGKVIQSFLREGLVDEMTITTIPVLIGEGILLFGQLEKDIKLKLLRSRSWPNGMVQSTYHVVK